jgi:hypothetical protein
MKTAFFLKNKSAIRFLAKMPKITLVEYRILQQSAAYSRAVLPAGAVQIFGERDKRYHG